MLLPEEEEGSGSLLSSSLDDRAGSLDEEDSSEEEEGSCSLEVSSEGVSGEPLETGFFSELSEGETGREHAVMERREEAKRRIRCVLIMTPFYKRNPADERKNRILKRDLSDKHKRGPKRSRNEGKSKKHNELAVGFWKFFVTKIAVNSSSRPTCNRRSTRRRSR